MTNAEKIIAELIDQHKINGEQAIELIKNLKTISISTPKGSNWYPTNPYQPWTPLDNNIVWGGIKDDANTVTTYNTNYSI